MSHDTAPGGGGASSPIGGNSNTNFLRQFLDSNPTANDGFLSYTYGLCPPHPLRRLTPSNTTNYSLWEEWADELPHLYQTGKYIDYFDSQPILSVDELDDGDLLRANQILGLCAHATVHFAPRPRVDNVATFSPSPGAWVSEKEHKEPSCPFKGSSPKAKSNEDSPTETPSTKKSEALVPPSILLPWKQVNVRLGRPTPTFTYYDYFTMNVVPRRRDEWRGKAGDEDDARQRKILFNPDRSPEQTYQNLRCDVQVFGDQSENIFVLVNHDMEFQSKDLVRLCCDAIDHVIAKDDDSLLDTLNDVGVVVKRITDAFLHAVPNSRSAHYCDPVSWSKSIGMLIPPILNDEFSMSGLQSSVVHLLDVFLGRYDYTGELGDLALAERPWLPSLHQEFFRLLQLSPSVRQYVCRSKSRSLKGHFDRAVRLFGSEQGFLGAHRIKTMGFLELGIKTGRTESSGQTAKADGPQGWQSRVWKKINEDMLLGMEQRLKLQSDSVAEGFTLALVQSIEELSPGSQSYRITMNIKNAGLSYKAGDRLEVLPANNSIIVKRMLLSLRVGASDLSESCLSVKVDIPIWREAISRCYPDLSDEEELPLPSLLRIMELRPLTQGMFDAICDTVGMKGNTEAENSFWRGDLNDVPDLIELLHELVENENCDALYNLPSKLCSILHPNKGRLYSIANSPPQGIQPTIVTIVVSKLWFQAEQVIPENHNPRRRRSSLAERAFHQASSMMLDEDSNDAPTKKVSHFGVCTSYLLKQSLFQYIPIRIAEEESFHLPSPKYGERSSNPPLVFLALGSGAAPIMAFLQELLDRNINDCPKEIYFCWGLRTAKNLIWLPLLSKAVKKIGLRLCISFSGEFKTVKADIDGNLKVVAGGKKERVTTTLLHGDWPETLSRLAKYNGHFFLCGHPSLELSFRSVVESALCGAGKLSPKESCVQYERLTADGRLHSDCFFSGSIFDPSLPSILVSDVARHSKFDDLWFIYKDVVYNVTEYLSLHPGGAKILFDKAGRDCTQDFEVAHGPNNLRVESAMQPYKIGNVCTDLSSNSFPDRRAFRHAVAFLHTVSEIKNVYYLDVNMFPGTGECNASPHSMAMRCKTAEKFMSSTVPLIISAMNCLCNELESQIPRSTIVSLKRSVPSQLSAFRKSLQHIIGNIASDGPYTPHPSIVTEICKIGCDFVSGVHNEAIEWLSSIEHPDEPPADTFPNLHAMCRKTLQALQTCTQMMNSSLPEKANQRAVQESLSICSLRGGRWCHIAPWLDMNACEKLKFTQGEFILRKDDIISSTYFVVSGKIELVENGAVVDILASGSVFGATSAPLMTDYKKNITGNELMKESVRVESNECLVCFIAPQQIIEARKSFHSKSFSPQYSGIVTSPHWRRALIYAKVISMIDNARKVSAIRCTSLYQYMDSGVCEEIAKNSFLESIECGKFFCKAGDITGRAWILLEGKVSVLDGETVVMSYTGHGTLFGETSFVAATGEEGSMIHRSSLIASENTKCVCIPEWIVESLCRAPLQRREEKFKWLSERLQNLPDFSSLPSESMVCLCHSFHLIKVWPSQNLFEKGESGEGAYIVFTGSLELTDGTDASILKSGDCAGLNVLSTGDPVYSHTCTGKESSTCWMISRSALVDLHRKSLHQQSSKVTTTDQERESLVQQSSESATTDDESTTTDSPSADERSLPASPTG